MLYKTYLYAEVWNNPNPTPPHPPKKKKKKKHPALPHVFLKQLLSEQLEVVQALPTSSIEEN